MLVYENIKAINFKFLILQIIECGNILYYLGIVDGKNDI